MIFIGIVYLLIAAGVAMTCSEKGKGGIGDIAVGLFWPTFLGMALGDIIRKECNAEEVAVREPRIKT